MFQLHRPGPLKGRGLMAQMRLGCGPWNVPPARGACRDVPVRRGGASLLLPCTGCAWARAAVDSVLWRLSVAETQLANQRLR